MSGIDARQIEAFLVVADELHFGRAAERLPLSTPQVSQLVSALERRVGGALFARTSRRVELTPLGLSFRGRVRPAYEGSSGPSRRRGRTRCATAAVSGSPGVVD